MLHLAQRIYNLLDEVVAWINRDARGVQWNRACGAVLFLAR